MLLITSIANAQIVFSVPVIDTGATGFVRGGIILGTGVGTIHQLGLGTTTTVLHGNASGDPTWSALVGADITNATIDLTTKITGTLPVANGGTGLATLTSHAIQVGAGTSALTQLGLGTTTTVLHGNASGDPTWSALVGADITSATIDLTTKVTGTLPVTNGGTGVASAIAYALLAGGTTSTGAFQSISGVGTSGQVLTSNGASALPTWQAASGGGMSNPMTTTGDIIYSSSGSTPARLAIGGATVVLHGGTTPSYSAVALNADVTNTLPVANGGTGITSYTTGDIPYASGSTTLSKLAANSNTGYVVTSNGASAAPTYQAPQIGGQWIYGSGNDGTVYFDGVTTPVAGATLSGSTYTLTRDVAGANITVSSGVTVSTANWRIYGTGTFLDSGTVKNPGANASGTTAGAASSTNAFTTSGAGAAGRTTNGNGATGTSTSNSVCGTGGTGGAAGSGGFTGGAGGTISAGTGTAYAGLTAGAPGLLLASTATASKGGSGGGAGGLNISTGSPTSGAGGAGGGELSVASHIITIVSGATVSAIGGTGSAAALAGGTGDAGGGGGGGGGAIYFLSDQYTNAGTVSVAGGSGGAGIGLGSTGATGATGVIVNVANAVSTGYLGTSVNLATQVTGLTPLANGGTNANLTANNGGIFWSNATQGQILAGTATAGQVLVSGATATPAWNGFNLSKATPSNPTGTSSATGVMMGLAGAITPTGSGAVKFTVTLNVLPGATGSPNLQIRYGTGTAPTNGAGLTGTTIGSLAVITGIASGSDLITLTASVTGLTVGNAYWFDVSLKSDGTSTANINNVYTEAFELK